MNPASAAADAAPLLAITMGDAAGIGPEIIVKALRDWPDAAARFIVVGDAGRLAEAVAQTNGNQKIVRSDPANVTTARDTVFCHDLELIPPGLPYGRISAIAGTCAFQAIAMATRWALDGIVAAIVTAPISKAALHEAGHHYPGHTEILAALAGVPEVSLMMARDDLRVIHVTMHMGLIDAIAAIEPGLVFRTIARAREAMLAMGVAAPRIAVCGINPHAGENGLFGHGEEESKIAPAIAEAQTRGWNVSGPYPADTLFYRARRGDFDIVVAMYHDQGLGPIKVLGIDEAVNVTVGLPVIRTSVGHGTAFDIAGKNKADARGMAAAIRHALLYTQRRSGRGS